MEYQSTYRALKGFSLIELMVVVAIMAIFATGFVMSSTLQSEERRLEGEAWRLVGELREARMEAVMANTSATITFAPGSRSWTRWLDLDHDGSVDSGEREGDSLKSSYVSSMAVSATSGIFTSDGSFTSSGGGPCQISVTNPSGDRFSIVILPSGEVDAVWN